jgi:hypothetical protein
MVWREHAQVRQARVRQARVRGAEHCDCIGMLLRSVDLPWVDLPWVDLRVRSHPLDDNHPCSFFTCD